jgi:DNA-binding transcriptional MocR family regulator
MCDALARHLGAVQVTIEEVLKPVISEPSFVRVTGGFFLWLRFPNRWDIDTDSFLDYCKSRNPPVTFFPGSFFCFGKYLGTPDSNSRVICDAWCKHAIRLCFAYLPESHIETAVLQLATAVLNISQGTTVADIQTITSS